MTYAVRKSLDVGPAVLEIAKDGPLHTALGFRVYIGVLGLGPWSSESRHGAFTTTPLASCSSHSHTSALLEWRFVCFNRLYRASEAASGLEGQSLED